MEEQEKFIFLVDDNPTYLNLGKSILQEKYTVVTIPSADKLFFALKKSIPDLILLDVEMPEMNGYEAIRKLKDNSQTKDIPVVFLTGKDEPQNELMGLSMGAVDYITKPFSPPLLLKRIEIQMLLQSQKNELREFNEDLAIKVKERTNDITLLQNAIMSWAAEMVEFRDEETGQHVERVQKYLKILLDVMVNSERYAQTLAEWDIQAFLDSSALHDVGKIKIRDDILLKKSSLTAEEFATMKLHTVYGKTMIESLQKKVPSQTFLDYAKTLAYLHHERWDGTGYPLGLAGQEIPLSARMMSFADVYDALVSERPYKKAFSHEKAMSIISEGRGTQFDPDLTDVFIEVSGKIREVGSAGRK